MTPGLQLAIASVEWDGDGESTHLDVIITAGMSRFTPIVDKVVIDPECHRNGFGASTPVRNPDSRRFAMVSARHSKTVGTTEAEVISQCLPYL